MPAEPATTDVPRKRITTPDGTVAELIETVPAAAPARGSVRTKARKRALDILFEADLRRPTATMCAQPDGSAIVSPRGRLAQW